MDTLGQRLKRTGSSRKMDKLGVLNTYPNGLPNGEKERRLIVMLNVEQWIPIPDNSVIHVVEYEGGVDHSNDVVDWVVSHGGRAIYSSAHDEEDVVVAGEDIHIDAAPEMLILETPEGIVNILKGHLIIKSLTPYTFFAAERKELETAFAPIDKD